MERQRKRTLAARLLLLVFLPILLFSSLHTHEASPVEGECYECANHLHHSGHISLQTASLHDCVLCQFVTLSFVAAVAVVLLMAVQAPAVVIVSPTAYCPSALRRQNTPRAPPVI